VSAVTAATAQFSTGERMPTNTVVVTVGIAPNPLAATLPARLDGGRVACDRFCRVEGWEGVYAAGDNAAIPNGRSGTLSPPTFLYAHTQGIHVAGNILAEMRGRPLRPYRYRAIGELALLTRSYGVGTFRGISLGGRASLLIGRAFYLAYTPTWRRRLTLMAEWLMASIFPPDITQVPTSRSNSIVPMRFGAGEVIIRQGEPGSRFYVISDGEVEVVRQAEDGSEEALACLRRGDFFGEIALLHGVVRTATIRATTPTRVLSIARDEFGSLMEHFPLLHAMVQQRADGSQAVPLPQSSLDTS
jgi:NADH dehydrogenase